MKTDELINVSTMDFVQAATMNKCGFETYKCIMSLFHHVDVSHDTSFQRLFTYHYKVRRHKTWLYEYYNIFENLRHEKDLCIGRILDALANASHDRRIELSFASKMLATINPHMPIWDSFVRKALNLPDVPPPNAPNRMAKSMELYADLVQITSEMVRRDDIIKEFRIFDSLFPDYATVFTPMKKLDILLWGKNRWKSTSR